MPSQSQVQEQQQREWMLYEVRMRIFRDLLANGRALTPKQLAIFHGPAPPRPRDEDATQP